jgi:type II secretory pathway pseudopilin PulG
MTASRPPSHSSQSGNVFVIILVAVALFAALSFTVARSMRSETTGRISAQKAALAAADTLNYAQSLQNGVNRLRQHSVSESDISFESVNDTAYAHSPAVTETEQVFHTSGGGASWQAPYDLANDGSAWIFTGETCIPDLATGASGTPACDADSDATNEELLAVLPNMDGTVCAEINRRLNITSIPADSGTGAATAKFTGGFADGKRIVLAGGPYQSACFSRGGHNYFYAVLIAR